MAVTLLKLVGHTACADKQTPVFSQFGDLAIDILAIWL
jgi:hypothetical protein